MFIILKYIYWSVILFWIASDKVNIKRPFKVLIKILNFNMQTFETFTWTNESNLWNNNY
jgi:hypothetical protein